MGMKRVEAAGEQGRMGTVKDVSRVSGDSLVAGAVGWMTEQ